MGKRRRYYLSLGSNISPDHHLVEAMRLLRTHGEISAISSVWESHAVGSDGPDFLNVCVSFATGLTSADVKRTVVDVIESQLGRTRTRDRNAPRTIDIDIVMDEGETRNPELWDQAFVILPMAELLPYTVHPRTGRRLLEEATTAQASTWIRQRLDVTRDLQADRSS